MHLGGVGLASGSTHSTDVNSQAVCGLQTHKSYRRVGLAD